MISRPDPDEYAPFYQGYVAGVAGADVLQLLEEQPDTLRAACLPLGDQGALFRYAPGKWSVKEVLGHLADAERIFCYRALRISRADPTPLSGFDENAYVAAARFDDRPLASLLDDFAAARASSLGMLRGIDPDAWTRTGVANGAPVSLRALAHIMAGHVRHHTRLLGERYGLELPGSERSA